MPERADARAGIRAAQSAEEAGASRAAECAQILLPKTVVKLGFLFCIITVHS